MGKLFFLVILITLAAGCGSKKPTHYPVDDYVCPLDKPADLKNIPQNLEVFAEKAGRNKRLLSETQQSELNAAFNRIFFGPWHMTRTSMSRKDISWALNKARGYKGNGEPWTQTEWDVMRQNANFPAFPSRAIKAITLRNTDLREVPTHEPRFSKPTLNVRENPFDYFQYSHLPVGTPILIAHTTLDGKWHFIECPVAGGWVDANDIAIVDDGFISLWQKHSFGALIKDRVNLPGTGPGGGDGKGGIGATLPVISHSSSEYRVLVPRRDASGYAVSAEIRLPVNTLVMRPMPLTPGNVAKVGNVMRGQPYGWGGMNGERDCSAMIRDLFTPFGLWLPRNSAAQARRGSVISLAGLNGEEKTRDIFKFGIPFLSLLGMKGHITLYIGEWNKKPVIFHNVWGVRIVKDGDDNERLVIGRAVITSITPGMELENLYRPVTFIDRLRTLTILGH